MATRKFTLSTYSSVTLTYTVTTTETAVTFAVSSVKFANTRSGGTVEKLWLSVATDFGNMTNVAIPKGTKTKTWAKSWSHTYTRGRSASTQSVGVDVVMYDADPETWDGSGTISVSVPAKASYAVTYDANGGSGAPASQTKWYGESLTLQSGAPTRAHHTFLGWSTDQAATAAQYQPSSSYTANAALKLYAVWQRVYAPPVLEITALYRCNSSGSPSDEGRYAAVEAAYALYSSSYTKTWSVSLAPSDGTGTALTATTPRSDSNGVAKFVLGGSLDTDTQYTTEVTLADSQGGAAEAVTVSASLPVAYYPIDVLDYADGRGVAIGGACTDEGFHIWLEMYRAGREFFPLFVYATLPDESDLPTTPCFVLDASDNGLYYFDGN